MVFPPGAELCSMVLMAGCFRSQASSYTEFSRIKPAPLPLLVGEVQDTLPRWHLHAAAGASVPARPRCPCCPCPFPAPGGRGVGLGGEARGGLIELPKAAAGTNWMCPAPKTGPSPAPPVHTESSFRQPLLPISSGLLISELPLIGLPGFPSEMPWLKQAWKWIWLLQLQAVSRGFG